MIIQTHSEHSSTGPNDSKGGGERVAFLEQSLCCGHFTLASSAEPFINPWNKLYPDVETEAQKPCEGHQI